MLIGSRENLAFESEIYAVDERYVFGHFCMWARGARIGDFSDVIMLSALEAQLERSLLFSGRRFYPEFANLEPRRVVELLYQALYGKGGDTDSLAERYGPANLTELGISAFDNLLVFLVDRADAQWLMCTDPSVQDIFAAQFSHLTFDSLAREYLGSLKEQISSAVLH